MTTSLKQRLVIAFSCVLAGCAIGATMPRLAAQSYPPNPTAQRWEQFCETTGSRDVGPVNRVLTLRGREGFELVSMDLGNFTFCFKRPAAR
jgi:hypothetical protein